MFGGEEHGSVRSVTRSNTETGAGLGAGLLDSASTIQITVTREFCQVGDSGDIDAFGRS